MTELSVTITRRLHPLEGQTLRVLGRLQRHGHEELLLVLQDGSKSFIPASWTDLDGTDHASSPAPTETLGTLADLLAASRLARAGITGVEKAQEQAARKPPTKGDDRATCAAEPAGGPAPDANARGVGGTARNRRRRGDQPPRRPHRQGLDEYFGRDGERSGGER